MASPSVIEQKGGADVYDSLFRQYYAPMVLYAMRMLQNQEEAEDVVQEVFVRLMSRENVEVGEKSQGLLFTMLHNRIIDKVRVDGRHRMASLSEMKGDIASEQDSAFEIELYAKLYQEIELLPRKNREVMRMKMKGMNDHDISEQLGISIETTRSHVKHGVKALRKKFDANMLSLIFM